MARVIVVGGGLAGMSAAHTVLEHGGNVLLLDKSPFCGGNSTKATSGINAAGSRTQRLNGVPDTPELFYEDTAKSASTNLRPGLVRTLTHESGPCVDWLMDRFGLDLTILGRLGSHSFPRTHRGKERFPGMSITYGLMEKLDEIAETQPDRAKVVNKATVLKLLTTNNEVSGVVFEKNGKTFEEHGPVILCTGGFGADFSNDSLLAQVQQEWRGLAAWNDVPDHLVAPLLSLPSTNGPHCTGDGIKMGTAIGAGTFDMHCVQVHPTGLVDPAEPDAKTKFLAAEALRGEGGLLLDRDGNRFCDELGKRDYVTGRMWKLNKAPYRLVLNSKSSSGISWHCEHYMGRGLMKHYKSGSDLAKDMGIPASNLDRTFKKYSANLSPDKDPYGKRFFNGPVDVNDSFHVAIVCPIVHYTMGGLACNDVAEILRDDGSVVDGLFGGGELLGGIHGVNRLGGSSLLDCVVYGRVAGRSAAKYLLGRLSGGAGVGGAGNQAVNIKVTPGGNKVSVEVSFGEGAGAAATSQDGYDNDDKDESGLADDFYASGNDSVKKNAGVTKGAPRVITMAEVEEHNKDNDCWVVIENKVYDTTKFLDDHPGGKRAIVMYAGKDATKEFNMLHKPTILTRYGADLYVGELGGAKM
jgi:flavocytochrome c